MRNRLNIIVATGLVVNLITGLAHAASQNPWAMYGGQKQGNTGAIPSKPQKSRQFQQPQQQNGQRRNNYEYVPLESERRSADPRQRSPYDRYQRQPYGVVPGYQYQIPLYGQGNLGGQFGFGMNFSPNFGMSGMPFGFGVPTIPFFGGSNYYGTPYQGQYGVPYQGQYGVPYQGQYGVPYGGYAPFGMGLPMF